MNQFIKYLFFALITGTLFSSCKQEIKETRLHILHYENSQGEKGITTYYYDKSGFNYGAKWELLNGSRWSENFHNYDTNGNMTLKYREFSDSLISYTWYTYNNKNQLVKEKFFRSDSISGEVYYKYDDSGKMTVMECQKYNGWLSADIYYQYDEQGVKKGAVIKSGEKEVGIIEYKYENNKLIIEHWKFNQGYNQTFTYEYEVVEKPKWGFYPSSNVYITNVYNYKVTLEEYEFKDKNNKSGGPSYFSYDNNGKLTKKTFVRTDSLKTVTDFEYDENGMLKRSIRHYNSGEKGIFNYQFNGNRKLLSKHFSLPDGIEGYEKYTYNEKIQLVKTELKNFDTWITGTIEYEHDKNGNLKVGHFKGERFNAEITFTYDENNNVIQYIWDIANGVATQTYKFTYEAF